MEMSRSRAALQADGTCWCGPTVWKGRAAMHVSVSSWATSDADVEQSIVAILRTAAENAGAGITSLGGDFFALNNAHTLAVEALYAGRRNVTRLATLDRLAEESRLAERGVTQLKEHAFLLT